MYHTSAAKQPGRTDWPNSVFHHQMMRVDMDMDLARSRCVNLNVEPLRGEGVGHNQIRFKCEWNLCFVVHAAAAACHRSQTLLLHVLRFYEYFAKYLPYDMSVFWILGWIIHMP